MLNPSVAQLLTGMADALTDTVLPELAPGPARDELHAAIGLTRRLARAVPGLGAYLHEDTVDLVVTLRQLWAALAVGEPTGGPLPAALAHADSLAATPPPRIDELTMTNLHLREAVAEVAARTDLDAATDAVLRAFLGRMARREAEQLRLSPWARL